MDKVSILTNNPLLNIILPHKVNKDKALRLIQVMLGHFIKK